MPRDCSCGCRAQCAGPVGSAEREMPHHGHCKRHFTPSERFGSSAKGLSQSTLKGQDSWQLALTGQRPARQAGKALYSFSACR